jgi:DNA-binding transcriptional LysR family regulator
VLAELEQLQEEASGSRAEPSGTLRIDMPVAFGRLVMLPLLAELARRYPQLSIDARFSDVYVDLVREGVDVAIRTGPLRDSTLVARKFGSQTPLLCAAPSYLASRGTPATVDDLSQHTAVVFRVPSHGKDRAWELRVNDRNVTFVPTSQIRIDDGDAIAAAATLGLGIAQLPHYMVAAALSRGELVEILPRTRPSPMPIAAVMPSARMIPARVRALLDLLERSDGWLPAAPPVAAMRTPEKTKRTPRRAQRRPRR